jgi:hypothetical protein
MYRLGILTAFCALALLTAPAAAQLPTATGRSLTIAAGTQWKVFIPSTYVQRPGNVADVLVLLHGDPQTVWNNAQWANLNSIIITANYGAASSAYQTPFSSNTSLFQTVLDQALAKVRAEADVPDSLQWDKLGLASFSAGYGGVREILKNPTYRDNIDALLAADSLYASTASDGTPVDSQMVDYKTFALAAKNGQKTFILTHSKVLTYTYENTIETADELMQSLGISPTAYAATGLGTLSYYRKADAGNFHVLGANGVTADDHAAHLRYIGDFLEDLPLAKLNSPLGGDYNNDGTIDAADYVVWRKTYGTRAPLVNDGGVSPGVTDFNDYNFWRSRYGMSAGSGNSLEAAAIPEPTSLFSFWAVVICVVLLNRLRSAWSPA